MSILKQRAQSGNELPYIRISAVQELARRWQKDADILPLLKQIARSDDNEYVRTTIMKELFKGWQDDPGIFEFLADCAVSDPFVCSENEIERIFETNPRQTALDGIIKLDIC